MNNAVELTVAIPVLDEAENLGTLLPWTHEIAGRLHVPYEILVISDVEDEATFSVCEKNQARLILQQRDGFGGAIEGIFREAQGQYILTMDADLSHPPAFLVRMWQHRHEAELIIASRYVRGGSAEVSFMRYWGSRALNALFRCGLSVPFRDLSSNFRLYKRSAVVGTEWQGTSFEIMQEILLTLYIRGWRIMEVPLAYRHRWVGTSRSRRWAFAMRYLATFWKMWCLRNSIESADYDLRGFFSRVWPQRIWQRGRYRLVMEYVGHATHILNVGCGTGKLMVDMPAGVGIDVSIAKLRFLRSMHHRLVLATASRLPIRSDSFECVVCSEVIEHTNEPEILEELCRVTRPGGTLIVTTPDYGRIWWPITEWCYKWMLPGGYADDHINRYSNERLIRELEALGCRIVARTWLFGSIFIVKAIVPKEMFVAGTTARLPQESA